MSNFRTVITKQSPSFFIQHPDPIFCMGSCFAQHIGQRLMRLKFSVDLNPFGILYNPVSIGKALQMLIQGQPYPPEALFEHQGLWHSFDHHSQFSHPNKSQALENINQGFHQASQNIAQSHYLLLTLGTAHVFTHHATSRIVANCHKLPADQFSRRRLRVEEIVSALSAHLQSLQQRSPHLKVILSVSPIRHWRDGAVENQRSKAALILAIAQLCEELPFVHYYPAYEILMDDLRDYRFYTKDLLHPNEQAIEYIWTHFSQSFFQESIIGLIKQIQKILTASEHRPFFPEAEAHQAFLKQQLDKIKTLENQYPQLDFAEEKQKFQQQFTA